MSLTTLPLKTGGHCPLYGVNIYYIHKFWDSKIAKKTLEIISKKAASKSGF